MSTADKNTDQREAHLPKLPGVYWYEQRKPPMPWRIVHVFACDGRLRVGWDQHGSHSVPLDLAHFPAGDEFRGPLHPGWVCHINVAHSDLKVERGRYAQRMVQLNARMQFCRQVTELLTALDMLPRLPVAESLVSVLRPQALPQILDMADQHNDLMAEHGRLMAAEHHAFDKEWAALNERLAKVAGGAP